MMYFENGELVMRKINTIYNPITKKSTPVYSCDVNILEDLQNSYVKYITETVYDDFAYLQDLLQEYKDMQDVTVDIYVKELTKQTYTKTQVNSAKMFWSVRCQFLRSGCKAGPEHEMLRIPYMDAYGRLNIDGKLKALVQEQRTAEDISYDAKKKTFNISTPTANIQLRDQGSDIKMKYGTKLYSMEEIVLSMMYLADDTTDLTTLFRTTALRGHLKLTKGRSTRLTHDNLSARVNILDTLAGKQYQLGATRDALNSQLSLDRAIGERLSRQTLDYPAGTLITEDMVKQFKRNQIHVVYVECFMLPEGYYFANGYLPISQLPKGFPVTDFVVRFLPEYAQYKTLPEDVIITDTDRVLVLSDDHPMTSDEVEFYRNYFPGVGLKVTAKRGSDKVIEFSFERDIIDNYTARLAELTDTIPEGRYADEWVYYYNNPTLQPVDDSHLNCHDFIAILSMYGEILSSGRIRLLDRDTSYLKKVQGINETFSEHLRKTLKSYVTKMHNSIARKIISGEPNNPLAYLTQEWIKSMNASHVLATPDTVNITAEVSQVNHVTTLTNGREVMDEERQIAMPYFGRLCPFETPAGKALGMVNTKAIGCRIINGLAYAPYRKVLSYNHGGKRGIYISSNITWMSVKDELGCKFGDMLTFKYDANGEILNTHVLARIPNTEDSHDPYVFKNIMAYELAGGYVAAYPEMFLSSTAAMMPCADSDNVVRISYGCSQNKQAIYLLNSQEPIVRTRMSKKIFDFYGTEESICPETGTVEEIIYESQYVKIRKDDGELFGYCANSKNPMHPWFAHGVSEELTFEWHIKKGDRVNKGDKIATITKQPQHYVVRAPMDGWIHNLHDEVISLTTQEPMPGLGLLDFAADEGDAFRFVPVRVAGQAITTANVHVHVGQHVKKGDILCDTWASRGGVYSPTRHPLVAYFSNGYNYEDGVCATERACVNYTSIIAHKHDISIKKKKDKVYRAEMNEGMKYCAPGEQVGVIRASAMAKVDGVFSYESSDDIVVRASLKEQGIPFEVNTLEDTPGSRKYRFHMLGFNKLKSGDKMAGHDGNKGVISAKVFKDSEAPQLMNGMTVEFILSPLGVPSRMNLGQIWEAHLSLACYILGIKANTEPYNGASPEEIRMLLSLAWDLANATAIGDNFTKQYNHNAFNAVCSMYKEVPTEVFEIAWNNIESIIDWRGAFNKDGTARLYDPETESFLDGDVVIGFPEFFKLMQETDEKLNVRSGPLLEDYAQNSMQPAKNENSAKGQRMAEMELVAMAAMGASNLIRETLNEAGDNNGLRINKHLSQLGLRPVLNKDSCYPRATENLLYYLEGMGVNLQLPSDVCDISKRATDSKKSANLERIVKRNFHVHKTKNTEAQSSDLEDIPDE